MLDMNSTQKDFILTKLAGKPPIYTAIYAYLTATANENGEWTASLKDIQNYFTYYSGKKETAPSKSYICEVVKWLKLYTAETDQNGFEKPLKDQFEKPLCKTCDEDISGITSYEGSVCGSTFNRLWKANQFEMEENARNMRQNDIERTLNCPIERTIVKSQDVDVPDITWIENSDCPNAVRQVCPNALPETAKTGTKSVENGIERTLKQPIERTVCEPENEGTEGVTRHECALCQTVMFFLPTKKNI